MFSWFKQCHTNGAKLDTPNLGSVDAVPSGKEQPTQDLEARNPVGTSEDTHTGSTEGEFLGALKPLVKLIQNSKDIPGESQSIVHSMKLPDRHLCLADQCRWIALKKKSDTLLGLDRRRKDLMANQNSLVSVNTLNNTANFQFDGVAAAAIVDLQLNRDQWIRQTVETFAFDGNSVMTRTAAYEFEIPRTTPEILGGYKLLPVATLARYPGKHLSVRLGDSRGQLLPSLTQTEERDLLAAGYAHIIHGASQREGFTEESIRDTLCEIIDHTRSEKAENPLDKCAESYPEIYLYGNFLQSNRTIFALVHSSYCGGSLQRVVVSHAEVFSLVPTSRYSCTSVNAKMLSLPGSILKRIRLVIEVLKGLKARPDEDSKGSYKQNRNGSSANEDAHDTSEHKNESKSTVDDSIPDNYRLSIPLDAILETQSYLAELSYPVGTYIERADLLISFLEDSPASGGHCESKTSKIQDYDRHVDRTYLDFRTSLLDNVTEENILSAKIDVVLRPAFHGGLRSGLWMTVFAWIVLLILLAVSGLSKFGHPQSFTASKSAVGSNNAIIALLLVTIITTFLAAIIRPEEHLLATEVQSCYKIRLSITGTIIFFIALFYAIGLTGWIMLILLAFGVVVTSVTLIFTRKSASHSKKRINVRQSDKRTNVKPQD